MSTPPSDTGHTSAAALYGSGGADPDFFFPAPEASQRAAHPKRAAILPVLLLKLIRR